MSSEIPHTHLSDALSEEDVGLLNALLSSSATKSVIPSQLAALLGMTYADGLAIIAALAHHGYVKPLLLVFHICDLSVPAGAEPFEAGFPLLPWRCPLCDDVAGGYKELRFDVQGNLLEPRVRIV